MGRFEDAETAPMPSLAELRGEPAPDWRPERRPEPPDPDAIHHAIMTVLGIAIVLVFLFALATALTL